MTNTEFEGIKCQFQDCFGNLLCPRGLNFCPGCGAPKPKRGYMALPAPARSEWWSVLGVPVNADAEQVVTAYRLLLKKFYPDKGSGDTAMYLRVQMAYYEFEMLKNESGK